MTPEEHQLFEQKIYAYVGREVFSSQPAPDRINEAMIRHWAEAMGDKNPAYQDAEWAEQSMRGRLIGPPAMMYCWNQEGITAATKRSSDALTDMCDLFDQHGYSGVLGTNVKQEYFKEAGMGDQVFVDMIIDTISEQKATARGIGYFFESLATFSDQHGEKIGTQRFRVLKFIPAEGANSTVSSDEEALETPTRIASPRGHDNGWWWEAADEGRMLIQRCTACQTLRHPPRPMCGECQSMDWDSIESTMQGEVLSFTEIHHPKVPGYPSPLICAVIKMDEGTNFVSNLRGCEARDASIGMRVSGVMEQVDDKTMLPQFYPATQEA